jgi:hypothetical protein
LRFNLRLPSESLDWPGTTDLLVDIYNLTDYVAEAPVVCHLPLSFFEFWPGTKIFTYTFAPFLCH